MTRTVWRTWPALMIVLLAATACAETTAPEPFSSGELAFDWAPEGDSTAVAWSAEGTCGARGFDLGAATCAVGSNENRYWAVLAVVRNEDSTYDTFTLVHPPGEGTCAATFTPDTLNTCTVELVRDRVDFPTEPVPTFVMSSGTITVTPVQGDGEVRLVGTFEGTLEDRSELGLDPITVTAGTFDVQFVP